MALSALRQHSRYDGANLLAEVSRTESLVLRSIYLKSAQIDQTDLDV